MAMRKIRDHHTSTGDNVVPDPYQEVYISVFMKFGHNQIAEQPVREETKAPTHFFIGPVIENLMFILYISSGLFL